MPKLIVERVLPANGLQETRVRIGNRLGVPQRDAADLQVGDFADVDHEWEIKDLSPPKPGTHAKTAAKAGELSLSLGGIRGKPRLRPRRTSLWPVDECPILSPLAKAHKLWFARPIYAAEAV